MSRFPNCFRTAQEDRDKLQGRNALTSSQVLPQPCYSPTFIESQGVCPHGQDFIAG